METKEVPEKKQKLVGAAVRLMLRHGYAATSVDEVCAEAGVTKGSFFHYFASKEEICVAAMKVWTDSWIEILANAKFDEIPDPYDRVEKLLNVMEGTYLNQPGDPGCLVGTVAQECSLPNVRLQATCKEHLETWQINTAKLLRDAKAAHPPQHDFDPEEVAWWLCSYVQGTLLIAKTRPGGAIITGNMKYCRAYVRGLFGRFEEAA